MPFYIVSNDGEVFSVETRVGNGVTVVEVKPVQQREQPCMEPEEQS